MKKWHNWTKSIIVNSVILVIVIMSTHMLYETSDDYVIASRIVDGYAEVFFVNYYLCRVLIVLQKIFTFVNVYVVAQIIASYVSFVCIYRLLLDKTNDRLFQIISAIIISVFSFDHYCAIQFTKTSAVMLIASSLLAIDTMIEKRGAVYYLLSFVLLYVGVAFRIDGLIVTIAFAGLFLISWVIEHKRELKERGYLNYKMFFTCTIIAIGVIGCYGFQILSDKANSSNEELQLYREYNHYRSDVVDYPVFDRYEENKTEYERQGFSKNDLYLIDHWFFDYEGAASLENLKTIVNIDNNDSSSVYKIKDAFSEFQKATIKSIKRFGFIGVHIMVLMLLAIWAIFTLKPRKWIYVIAIGAMTACMHLALYYIQRPGYRALYIADIGAAVWLLYAISLQCKTTEEPKNKKKIKKMHLVGIPIAICLIALLIPLRMNSEEAFTGNKSRVMSDDLKHYIDIHKNYFYVFAASEKKSGGRYIKPFMPPDTKGEANIIGTGSWGTMSPYLFRKMEKYNIRNPIKDLIDNDAAFYIGNKNIKRMTEYYNKWYGTEDRQIFFEQVNEVDGYKVWQVKSNG